MLKLNFHFLSIASESLTETNCDQFTCSINLLGCRQLVAEQACYTELAFSIGAWWQQGLLTLSEETGDAIAAV